MDTAYTYGNERIALERFTGWTGYYTYDPRGYISGVTDSGGRLWKSYRYGPTGDITFGKPQYNNSYAYNAEDYNPNLETQYLRARYYDVERGNFLTEDTYLGKLTDPLTLNRYNYVKSSAPNYVDPSGHKKQSWTETADQAKKNWQEYNKMPVQDYDSGPDYGSKNKERLEELDKKLSTARTKLKKLMDAAEEKGKSVIGYCSDYKAGMDAGRKIAEAEYHNWELTLLFGKNAYRRDDYFGDTDLQEIYDQARNASNNKDAFSAGFTAGQTMFTIEILSLIVGALESGGSSSGGQQVVLPGVGEVTIPGDAAGSVAGVLPPGSILRDQENKKESEEEGKGEADSKKNKIPDNDSTTGHIFRDAEGHIPDTPENRALLEEVANDSANLRGTDKYGNEWYTKTQSDGSQVWVESRNGNIFEGGVNNTPKPWNPDTGLKKP
ncbi:hypothetical protein HMPREF1020_03082 [Clostridium sp. 7_3_54FAA]|nr:hypothetical protein HMPREF1020_03082 [Clostridium sp. 7_3_54FAA]